MINLTNNIYKLKKWAVINEVPTPWQVERRGGKIINAYPTSKSTVDYYGVCGGRAIAFDVKSTKVATRFDLKNVHEHQVNYLRDVQDQGGVAFFIIEFASLQETYYVPLDFFLPYWMGYMNGERKSISHGDIAYGNDICKLLKSGRGVAMDYLVHLPIITGVGE